MLMLKKKSYKTAKFTMIYINVSSGRWDRGVDGSI